MNSQDLRRKFLDFFVKKGHKEMPAASLIPENDPSVLFTTAGMQQFKRFYTQPQEAPAKNVVTIQPCFRTSDIDLVGDETHLTFFEMLGNFSFGYKPGEASPKGGYFKKEAIEIAYEFLTKELGIEKERIWCSIFAGDDKNLKDKESSDILKNMRIRIEKHNRDDNFWGPTGQEGPCGPTVEFYVDKMEVWNLVFNEYYYKDGKYETLETKGVDTGMGLERMLVILNGKNDVYETDVFESIIQEVEKISGKKYQENQKAFRVVADHVKSAIFLTNDGILPSNVGQGYVLRRLIRRAVRYVWQIEMDSFDAIIPIIIEKYNPIYKIDDKVIEVLKNEEKKFNEIIQEGIKEVKPIFVKKKPIEEENYSKIMQLPHRSDILGRIHHGEINEQVDPEFQKNNIQVTNKQIQEAYISGKEAFNLYQTYGFPLEAILDLAQKEHLFVGITDFEDELKKHQDLSRTASAGMFKGGLQSGGGKETKYHSATHLLLASLRKVLGDNVHQKGSNITAERLRFDFSYPEKLTSKQIKQVEDIVNEKIKADLPVKMEEMPLQKALEDGATSIPGFNYPEKVKVYSIGDFSKEICGGPHVTHTGELGAFKITKEESCSAGIRRIKAILK